MREASNHTIPDRSPPALTRNVPPAVHLDCYKRSEDLWKRQRHHWHMEHKDTKSCGKLQELTHEMDRYRWNILGLCEVTWKNLVKQQQGKDTKFSPMEKRTNTSVALDFLFKRTS